MTQRGVSLIEVLLACVLVAIVGGVVAALSTPLRVALGRADVGGQLEPAGRAALDALIAELQDAGAPPPIADRQWTTPVLLRGVTPLVDLDALAAVSAGRAVQIRHIPPTAAQATLAVATAVGATTLRLDTTSRCRGGPPACGFREEDPVAIYSSSAAESAVVRAAGTGMLSLTRPLSIAFPAGAVVVRFSTTRYGTRTGGDGAQQLVRISDGGAEQPLLDNVVDFALASDSADLSQTSQVAVVIRVEAPAAFRGTAGYLFFRAGTSSSAGQWVPDAQLGFNVALRNPRRMP